MYRYWPDRKDFLAQIDAESSIPVYGELLGDNLTPVTAFARVAPESPHAFLLESVVGGEKIARYSFIAAQPVAVFEARNGAVRIQQGQNVEQHQSKDPLQLLEKLLAKRKSTHLAALPRFVGGAVGYASYDAIRYYESLPGTPRDDRSLPDLLLGLYDSMIIFDHLDKTIKVVCHARLEENDSDKDAAYDRACRRIDHIVEQLSQPRLSSAQPIDLGTTEIPQFESTMSQDRFRAGVDRIQEYIRAGDVFQTVLSHRLRVRTKADTLNIYRALRVVNPSPFMFYLKSPEVVLIGSSPEIMCRVEDSVVTSRPLAGTRPRGRSAQEDAWLERELLADPKERAEHIMLVDLARNDISRVAEPGSVELSEVMSVERYSHVMHICTNVSGRLAPGRTAFDALRATLPVGTVSGAPKVRAMQIIDELEPVRRGPYGGAVGYIDFAGNMDMCIALRTMAVTPDGDASRVDIQVGAGIVAESDPASEYNETLSKARGMLKAVHIAEQQM